MRTKSIHLAYLSLLILLVITILFSFPYSLYLFATIKALIIISIFMHLSHAEEISKIYLFFALALLGIAFIGIIDDYVFR
ncbi:MAG: hypothetical protein AB7I27_13485 [Bacteriovoracaceae bacterium]